MLKRQTNWCGGLGGTVGRGCDVIDSLQGVILRLTNLSGDETKDAHMKWG